MNFSKKQPCNNCPYRKDAPLQLWAKEEFMKLYESEKDELGAVYQCHKKDDHVCVGWLIDQRDRNYPSIRLRLALSKHRVPVEYLESLSSPKELFESVLAMCKANYKRVFSMFK